MGTFKALTCLVAVAALTTAVSACSSDTNTSPSPNPSTSAPIAAGALVLTGNPVKGSTLLLNGKLTNSSSEAIKIVGGSAYFATQLQVIDNVVANGETSVQVGVPLTIAGNDSVALNPKGYQIRVIKLTQNLKRGATVPLNITLATGQTMTAKAKVA